MAGNVLPKVAVFLFLSFICMLVNFAACFTALAMDPSNIDTGFYINPNNEYTPEINDDINDSGTNVTAINFIAGAGTSFLPFASIVSLSFLNIGDTPFLFVSLVIAIIGALQAFLLSIIILNFVPNVLGSGVEV